MPITMKEGILYESLIERLRTEYSLMSPFVIEYQDTEGDTITIRSQLGTC